MHKGDGKREIPMKAGNYAVRVHKHKHTHTKEETNASTRKENKQKHNVRSEGARHGGKFITLSKLKHNTQHRAKEKKSTKKYAIKAHLRIAQLQLRPCVGCIYEVKEALAERARNHCSFFVLMGERVDTVRVRLLDCFFLVQGPREGNTHYEHTTSIHQPSIVSSRIPLYTKNRIA